MNAIQQALDCLKNGNRTWEAMEILEKALAVSKLEPQAQSEPIKQSEMYRELVQSKLASKPEPQAQAGEPEVVLTVEVEPDFMSRGHFHEGYKPYVDPTKVWSLSIGTELITLQAHREAMASREPLPLEVTRAIAKRDAALVACVELGSALLAKIRRDAPDLSGKLMGEFDAAIQQAKEARK